MNKRDIILISAFTGILAFSLSVRATEVAPPAAPMPLYATVDDTKITLQEFHNAFNNYLRQKFYHGQVSEEQVAQVRKEVNDLLVDRILLLGEAKRRGLVVDESRIAQAIAEYDTRYAKSEKWQANRESMLPGLKQQLTEQELLRQIEEAGHAIAEPTDEAVREFHKARIELFTEPEKMRLHTILLKVDPSAPKALWDAAREEAARIVALLQSGKGDFEELARLHSHDGSAEKGGDMGYLHRGMIPDQVIAQLEKLPRGTVGAPVDVLEGIAIFRLDDVLPAKEMPYQDVTARARALLKREQSTQAWDAFIAGLRKPAVIKLIEPTPPIRPAQPQVSK